MKKIFILTFFVFISNLFAVATYAIVNGEKITDTELAPIINGIPGMNFDALNPAQKKQIIDRAIEIKLLADQAKKEGIVNDPTYQKELEMAKNTIAIRAYQAKQLQSIKIPDAEIKKFYDQNKNKFIQPMQLKARHILVKDKSEAKSIINQLSKLKGDKLDAKFAELAKEDSIDTGTKDKGGELGWFVPNQMVPSFSKAVMSLKNDQITKTPVKSQFGYHIILKEGEKKPQVASLEQAKPFIENILRQEKLKEMISKEAQDLRKNAKITYGE